MLVTLVYHIWQSRYWKWMYLGGVKRRQRLVTLNGFRSSAKCNIRQRGEQASGNGCSFFACIWGTNKSCANAKTDWVKAKCYLCKCMISFIPVGFSSTGPCGWFPGEIASIKWHGAPVCVFPQNSIFCLHSYIVFLINSIGNIVWYSEYMSRSHMLTTYPPYLIVHHFGSPPPHFFKDNFIQVCVLFGHFSMICSLQTLPKHIVVAVYPCNIALARVYIYMVIIENENLK